jgi:hypothetical protein
LFAFLSHTHTQLSLSPRLGTCYTSSQLVENNDAVWDDGVAPELALDFDCQHVSKTEGIFSWLGGLGLFVGLYQVVKMTDPQSKNPAVNRKMNVVVEPPRTGPPPTSE